MSLSFLTLNLVPSQAQKPREIDWQPPLAEGGAPECPDHVGSRTLRSETVSMNGVGALIIGTAVRAPNRACQSRTDLIFTGSVQRKLSLPDASDHSFSIVDFSPDGHSLLLTAVGDEGPPNWDNRSISVAVVALNRGGIEMVNAWDLFRWGKCYATVEPQGFTEDGKVMLLARPSVWTSDKVQPNCVSNWGLYETNLQGPCVRLPDDTKVPRFGRAIADQVQACKTDPDIIGACFTVHGRLSAWNGSPALRIWRVGTKRILGNHDEWPLPQELAEHMGWGVEAWGDFEVCPFTEERPGVMQMVCIESAKNVVYKKW